MMTKTAKEVTQQEENPIMNWKADERSKAERLPIRSETRPMKIEPRKMPKKSTLPRRLTSGSERFHSFLIVGRMTERERISASSERAIRPMRK